MAREWTMTIRAWLKALAENSGAFRVETVEPAKQRGAKWAMADYFATLLPADSRKRVRLVIEARARLNPREALAACAQLGAHGGRDESHRQRRGFDAVILACPYVSARVAEICREHGVGYLDQAGNCDIRANGLVVHVAGRPNVAPDTRSLARPFTPKGSRVARLILAEPQRTWQIQELATKGRISLGLAFKAKDALLREGFVEEREGRIALRDGRALLGAWSAMYKAPTRRTQLYIMDEVDHAEQAVAKWCERHRVEYGLAEFSGAWRLAPMVRHKQASVCLRESTSRDLLAGLMKSLDAKPVETGSNLAILVTADESVFMDVRSVENVRVLSPVQLFLDLAPLRGRGREAADEVLRRVLEPSFERQAVPTHAESKAT